MIVIVTLNDPENYGNRLQNYALTLMLQKYGEVTTAFCAADRKLPVPVARLFHPFVAWVKRMLSGLRNRNISLLQEHHNRCVSFSKKYVPNTEVGIDAFFGAYPKKGKKCYVIGSDQVWNYNPDNLSGLALHLGAFAPWGTCISYAASFGVSSVEGKARDIFARYLPRITAISVREIQGQKLVKELSGLETTVVLDPTLMISPEQWSAITQNFVAEDDKYVLTYFLGVPSAAQEKIIQSYALEHGCRVRRLLDLRDSETYVAGPQDFVELFSKAQYVFTDSYHACCFSILNHKQFTVFNRSGMSGKASMNSRMETLFCLFNLDAVMMDEGLAPKIDYENVDLLLEQYRAESQAWLDKAMEAIR